MNKQKILKIILILIGLLIIITSGIFIIQTLKDLDNLKFSQVKNILHKEEENLNIDIANWKTYRNEELGFEFRYPGEFMIEEGEESPGGIKFVSIKKETKQNVGVIKFIPNSQNKSLKEFVKIYNEGEYANQDLIKEFLINNNLIIYEETFVVSDSNDSGLNGLDSKLIEAFWKNKNGSFTHFYNISKLLKEYDINVKLFNEILQTFKFF